jgi:hypothetical protein
MPATDRSHAGQDGHGGRWGRHARPAARGSERLLDYGGRSVDAVFMIGEQVNVPRGARCQAVGQQGAAAEGEPVPGGAPAM